MSSALLQIICDEIDEKGPLPLDRFMELSLLHPQYGYYQKSDPFGAGGDFVTAPEISQMFGELIGLWCVDSWSKLGCPQKFILCETGPGRGTLMMDALRSSKLVPEFQDAADIYLIEQSEILSKKQEETLKDYPITWLKTVDELPKNSPLIIIGNEFLDALPIRQFISMQGGWQERRITRKDDTLEFCTADTVEPKVLNLLPSPKEHESGTIIEWSAPVQEIVEKLSKRIENQGGYALFVDYGPEETNTGDSFQAVRNHNFTDPLQNPGANDLTAHVRFGQLGKYVEESGELSSALSSQGRFLERLGIEARAMILRETPMKTRNRKLLLI